jgi:hypothetical protein
MILIVRTSKVILSANSDTAGDSTVWRDRHPTRLDLDEGTVEEGANLRYPRDRTQKMIEPTASGVNCLNVDNALLTIPERARAGTVEQTQLLIGPNWIDHIRLARNADASTSTESFPIASTVNIQFDEDLIDCADEMGLLFESVPGCNSDTEAFLAAGDSWIINSLNVNVVFRK